MCFSCLWDTCSEQSPDLTPEILHQILRELTPTDPLPCSSNPEAFNRLKRSILENWESRQKAPEDLSVQVELDQEPVVSPTSDSESFQTTETSSTENSNGDALSEISQTSFLERMTVIGRISMSTGQDIYLTFLTPKESRDPKTIAESLLASSQTESGETIPPTLEEACNRISILCSAFLPPLDEKSKKWLTKVFQSLEFSHPHRTRVVAKALNILTLSPSDFPRTTEQTISLVRKSFALIERELLIHSECQICGGNLSNGSVTDTFASKVLVCSGLYGPHCHHKFCYACWSQLQQSHLGDFCPSCRASLEIKRLLRIRPKTF